MNIDPQHLGNQIVEWRDLKPGMEVLWVLQYTGRDRYPYMRGDILEVTIDGPPWINGKIAIIAKVGIKSITKTEFLFWDRRKNEQEKIKTETPG